MLMPVLVFWAWINCDATIADESDEVVLRNVRMVRKEGNYIFSYFEFGAYHVTFEASLV